MAKKIKNNTNRGKKTDTDVNKTTVDKKKQQQQKQKKNDKNKVAIIKDQNVQFKSKLKKNKYQLAKKFKQIQSNEKKQTFDVIRSSVNKGQNKGQNIKTKFQIENKRQRKKQKNSERHKQKEEKKEQRKEMKQKEQKKEMKQKGPKMAIKQKEHKMAIKQKEHKIAIKQKEHKMAIKQKQHKIAIKQKEHKIKVKNSNQSNNKTNSNEQFLNKKHPKSIKSERNKKQMSNNKTKIDLALHKTKPQKNTPKKHNLDIKKLKKLITTKQGEIKVKSKNTKPPSLRERMITKLKASRFRYLNETLYNSESSESKNYFKNDPDAFKAYHEGYKQQVEQWPLNPLDVIIASIKKMPKEHIVADFGCGEAKLTLSVPQKVHSFDFLSLNENVTVCDVAHTPLLTSGVNVVVFCLSLMGTNLNDYIIEANRVLKKGGILKIAEVESRFDQIEDFIKTLSSYGFKNTWKDLSHNLFYFLDFKKERDIGSKRNKLPPIILKPCLYKKR